MIIGEQDVSLETEAGKEVLLSALNFIRGN